MKVEDLLSLYPSYQAAMRNLGFSKNTYCMWRKRGGIPFLGQAKIEIATDGKLKMSLNDIPEDLKEELKKYKKNLG